MALTNKMFSEVRDLMIKAIEKFIEKGQTFNPNGKSGGCLAYDDGNGNTNFTLVGSNIGDEKKYYQTALRKIQQMKDHSDHVSSWQSRNPDNGEWGWWCRGGLCRILRFLRLAGNG